MSMLIERARQWGEELNQEWLERGRVEGEREMVRRLVARRFGEGAAKDFVPVLANISDPDRLAAIAAEVFTMRDGCGTGRMGARGWDCGVSRRLMR